MILLTEHVISFAEHRRSGGTNTLAASELVETTVPDLATFLAQKRGERTVELQDGTLKVSFENHVGVTTYVAEVYGETSDLDALSRILQA